MDRQLSRAQRPPPLNMPGAWPSAARQAWSTHPAEGSLPGCSGESEIQGVSWRDVPCLPLPCSRTLPGSTQAPHLPPALPEKRPKQHQQAERHAKRARAEHAVCLHAGPWSRGPGPAQAEQIGDSAQDCLEGSPHPPPLQAPPVWRRAAAPPAEAPPASKANVEVRLVSWLHGVDQPDA